jgi:hypothetical protein
MAPAKPDKPDKPEKPKKEKKGSGITPLWPIIVLSFMNLVAAGVLFYAAGQVFYARVNWTRLLDERRAERDGITTADVLKNPGLTEEDRRKIRAFASEYVQRKAAANTLLAPLQEKPEKIGDDDSKKTSAQLGADDYRKILHEFQQRKTPLLRAEEQALAAQKDSLLMQRRKYDQQIKYLTEQIARQEKVLGEEKAITEKIDTENQARRVELAQLFSEIEEAVAARGIAEGRERDMKDLIARTRKKTEEVAKENLELTEQLRRLEGIASGREGDKQP